MATYEAVFAADTHIDSCIWTTRRSIKDDAYVGFRQVINTAIHHHCPLFLCGDILECLVSDNPTSEMLQFTVRQLRRMQAKQLPVYFVQGQHDKASPPWLSAISPWAIHIDQMVVELPCGLRVAGMDYTEPRYLPAVAEQVRALEADIYVCHQHWGDFLPKVAAPRSDGMIRDFFPRGDVVSGDLHQQRQCQDNGRYLISPGATHMRKLREPTEHYMVGLRVVDGKRAYRLISLHSRPVLEYVLATSEEFTQAVTTIETDLDAMAEAASARPIEISQPLVVLRDRGVGIEAIQELRDRVGHRGHVILDSEVVDISEAVTSSQVASNATLREALTTTCPQHPEIVDMIEALVASPTPAQLFEQFEQGYLEEGSHAVT